MSEELGIYVTVYDKFSPAVKSMENNTKAFDKAMQELEQTCAAYEKRQEVLVKDMAVLKSRLTESNAKVKGLGERYAQGGGSGEEGNRHKNERGSAKNRGVNQEVLIVHICSLHSTAK